MDSESDVVETSEQAAIMDDATINTKDTSVKAVNFFPNHQTSP